MKRNAKTIFVFTTVLVAAGYFALARWQCHTTLQICDADGLTTEWKNGDVFFSRRPLNLFVSGEECKVDAVTLGEVLQDLGSVRDVTLSRVDFNWLDSFLGAWTDQSSVTDFYVLYSPMNDVQFGRLAMPHVRTAMFKDLEITGQTCPPFPHLTLLELEGVPITDQGLARIVMQCPQLEKLNLINTDVSPSGLKSSGLFSLPSLKSILMDDPDYSAEQLTSLRAYGKSVAPEIEF